jgi:hypothetical protein
MKAMPICAGSGPALEERDVENRRVCDEKQCVHVLAQSVLILVSCVAMGTTEY